VKADPYFNAVKTSSEWLEKVNDKEYSLNIVKFRDEQKKIRSTMKQLDEISKNRKELSVSILQVDEQKLAGDTDKMDRRKQWTKYLAKDSYLTEAVNVVGDMIKQGNIVKK
jgi:carboxyl-terminal processing protease